MHSVLSAGSRFDDLKIYTKEETEARQEAQPGEGETARGKELSKEPFPISSERYDLT